MQDIKNGCFVGFDTSNYTTSVAACDMDGKVIANVKLPLTVKEGERGLRQSDAVFLHVKNLGSIFETFNEKIRSYRRIAVAASSRPRNAEGSYMPCFLVGNDMSKSFSSAADIPEYSFSHQDGHIMAALYSSMNGDAAKIEKLIKDGFAAFHVSGGTTELLKVTPENGNFTVSKIGGTTDLNAGQAIDRSGVAMGLKFPCGPEMERLSQKNTLPVPPRRISVKGLDCCLSGLENLAEGLYKKTQSPECVSAYVFEYVADVISKMTCNLRAEQPDIPIVYAGGVMSNKTIQSRLAKHGNVYFAAPEFSSDNAAGIALLCRREYLKQI